MQGISHYNILRQFTCISRRHYRSGRPPPASASVVIVSVVPRAAGCCCRRGRAGTRGRRDRPATPPRGASLLNVLITGYVPSYDLIIKKCAARSHAGVTRMSGPSLTAESCEQFKINRRVASCAVRLSGVGHREEACSECGRSYSREKSTPACTRPYKVLKCFTSKLHKLKLKAYLLFTTLLATSDMKL